MNLLSKKIYFLVQKNNSPICTLKIFDIEEEKCFKKNIFLRVLSNLEGISQLNVNNSLYLCGINGLKTENVIGSHLLKVNIEEKKTSIIFLVNSIFTHYNPSMTVWKSDLIIVVGGKGQIECEGYIISKSKWIELPFLCEDRYKCSLFSDDINNMIYLFGGFSKIIQKNMKTILRLNLDLCEKWDIILVRENENYLARNSSTCFMFDNDDIIYICGGYDNKNEETEFICEYDIFNRTVKKSKYNMKINCSFDLQGFGDLNKQHFVFMDNNFLVHTISRKDFNMMIIPFDHVSISEKL